MSEVQVLRVFNHDGSMRVVHLRATDRPDRSVIIDNDAWAGFVAQVKAGAFDVGAGGKTE